MLNKDVHDALLSGEFGDARSYLDEIDPKGQTSITVLNKVNSKAVWLFDVEDGWGYIEI
ncbi:hypothetical protein ACUYPW_003256 [Vibrio vulnificus]